MSAAQQKKVWFLMFQLEKFDPAPKGVQLHDRLCGLIEKQFGGDSLLLPTIPVSHTRTGQCAH